MNPRFFATPAELRAWLEEHHDREPELWVGLYKKSSGRPSVTWPEVVDEALCFGWIDGVRQGIDDSSYANRLTPRTPRSTWSAVNIARVKELTARGRMHPAGLKAFEARADERSAIYSYEQRKSPELEHEQERQFRDNAKAWDWFQSQVPSYRKAAIWWVISAKREETKAKRLATLIEDSEQGRTVKPLTRSGAKTR
jgi:uncharacterized protein YdeI (YjbR/CyaY-like superfamily)